MKLKKAIKVLTEELAKDKSEGSYYYSWQSNIAMAFYDEMKKREREDDTTYEFILNVANQAAKNFLDLLIKK